MNRKTAGIATVTVLVGSIVLTACGGGGSSTVDGLRDDLKTKAAVKEISHYETQIKSKTVCTRKVKGVCKSTKTEKETKRVKVIDKAAKPALYCVELDDVNGSVKDDDVWYTVTLATYVKAAAKDEGDPIKKMSYSHSGCWR